LNVIKLSICDIFGDVMTLWKSLNNLDEETYLVVKSRKYLQMGDEETKIHCMVSFDNQEKSVLDVIYNDIHSSDMNYYLVEIAFIQDEAENGENSEEE
jgi:hypothetical protein